LSKSTLKEGVSLSFRYEPVAVRCCYKRQTETLTVTLTLTESK